MYMGEQSNINTEMDAKISFKQPTHLLMDGGSIESQPVGSGTQTMPLTYKEYLARQENFYLTDYPGLTYIQFMSGEAPEMNVRPLSQQEAIDAESKGSIEQKKLIDIQIRQLSSVLKPKIKLSTPFSEKAGIAKKIIKASLPEK